MWIDVRELRDFYACPLGHMARRFVRRRIRSLWSDADGLDVLGMGYATPYLRPYKDSARRVMGFMPAGQGVVRWPLDEPSQTALVDETALPLPDASIDRVLLVHGLENGEAIRPMMREIWRVLAPEGRLLVVVPSRSGIWARMDRTPFGHGRPFSQGQLERLLEDCMFSPERTEWALFMPPIGWRFLMTSAAAWEDAGRRFWRGFGGVLIIEASKHVVAVPRKGRRVPVLAPVGELAGRRWPLRPRPVSARWRRDGRSR